MKSERTEGQWRASVRDYVLPRLARKRVDAVTTADVMAVLLPIWSTKRVTAARVRQRIGAVMKWAVAQGYRDDNPAGDAISAALPKAAVRKQHMRALPHAEVGAARARVRGSGAYRGTMLAFEFLVLTAARSGEVRNARPTSYKTPSMVRAPCMLHRRDRIHDYGNGGDPGLCDLPAIVVDREVDVVALPCRKRNMAGRPSICPATLGNVNCPGRLVQPGGAAIFIHPFLYLLRNSNEPIRWTSMRASASSSGRSFIGMKLMKAS